MHNTCFFSSFFKSLYHSAASDRHRVATRLRILPVISGVRLLSFPETPSRQLVIVVLVLDVVYG